MKNVLLKIIVSTFAITLLGVSIFAQTAKRIDFAKEGSNSLVWEERVAANSSKSFVFYAKKGQKLSLSMVDDTNQGSMDLGKISIEPNADPFEMDIEVSKDYTLSVSNNSNKSTSFRIAISLENAKTSTSPVSTNSNEVRVQFAKGETSTMITKDIAANGSVDFLINAKKGQLLEYTVGYDFRDSDVQAFLTEPGMQDISHSSGPKDRQEFTIQKSGDHRLTVNNTTKKKITITLYLDINNPENDGGQATNASPYEELTGAYFAKGALPRTFAEIDHLFLGAIDDSGNPAPLNGFIRPKKQAAKDYELIDIMIDGKDLSFATKSVKGVSYVFNGAFVRMNFGAKMPNSNEVVLKGTLSRLVDGEAADETEVSFTFTVGG